MSFMYSYNSSYKYYFILNSLVGTLIYLLYTYVSDQVIVYLSSIVYLNIFYLHIC